MIRGTVNSLNEVVVRLPFRAPGKPGISFDTILDTGFTGTVALPQALVDGLGLAKYSEGLAVLADGTKRTIDWFAIEVEWDGEWIAALTTTAVDQPLLGMALLAGYEIRIRAIPGGTVEIERLP